MNSMKNYVLIVRDENTNHVSVFDFDSCMDCFDEFVRLKKVEGLEVVYTLKYMG